MSEPITAQAELAAVIDELDRLLERLKRLRVPSSVTPVPDDAPLSAIGLDAATVMRLRCDGILTVAQLESRCFAELLDIRAIGTLRASRIEDALAQVGRHLSEWTPGR